MTHFVREIPGGIELRSRFWIGYGLVDGRLVKLVPDGVSVPEEVPMGLFAHNLKEFGHLAAILPQSTPRTRTTGKEGAVMCKKSKFPLVFNIFLAFFITFGGDHLRQGRRGRAHPRRAFIIGMIQASAST